MLNGNLSLHGVNAEKLARSVLNDALKARRVALDEGRRDDLLAELIAATWELAERYDPRQDYAVDRDRRPGFDGWATYWLRLRVVDWFRRTEGRTKWQFAEHVYERTLPEFVSFDAELDSPVGPGSMDPAAHSDADLRGVLERGDSAQAWEAIDVGERATRRATRRAA